MSNLISMSDYLNRIAKCARLEQRAFNKADNAMESDKLARKRIAHIEQVLCYNDLIESNTTTKVTKTLEIKKSIS